MSCQCLSSFHSVLSADSRLRIKLLRPVQQSANDCTYQLCLKAIECQQDRRQSCKQFEACLQSSGQIPRGLPLADRLGEDTMDFVTQNRKVCRAKRSDQWRKISSLQKRSCAAGSRKQYSASLKIRGSMHEALCCMSHSQVKSGPCYSHLNCSFVRIASPLFLMSIHDVGACS